MVKIKDLRWEGDIVGTVCPAASRELNGPRPICSVELSVTRFLVLCSYSLHRTLSQARELLAEMEDQVDGFTENKKP